MGEEEKGVRMCLSDLVCFVCISRLCALLQEEREVFHCRVCFLPIKQALISITMPELRGSGVPGCYLRSVQSKLGYSVYTSELKQPEQPNGCRWSSTDVASFAKSAPGKLSTQLCQNCCFFFFSFFFLVCYS